MSMIAFLLLTLLVFLVLTGIRIGRRRRDDGGSSNMKRKRSRFNQRIGGDTAYHAPEPYAPSYRQSPPPVQRSDIETRSDVRPAPTATGKQICPSCRREVPVGFPGCPYCDHIFGREAEPEAPRRATKVERPPIRDRRSRAPPPQPPSPPTYQPPAPAPAPMYQEPDPNVIQHPIGGCPKCGAPIMPNTDFCKKCGWRVRYGKLVGVIR